MFNSWSTMLGTKKQQQPGAAARDDSGASTGTTTTAAPPAPTLLSVFGNDSVKDVATKYKMGPILGRGEREAEGSPPTAAHGAGVVFVLFAGVAAHAPRPVPPPPAVDWALTTV